MSHYHSSSYFSQLLHSNSNNNVEGNNKRPSLYSTNLPTSINHTINNDSSVTQFKAPSFSLFANNNIQSTREDSDEHTSTLLGNKDQQYTSSSNNSRKRTNDSLLFSPNRSSATLSSQQPYSGDNILMPLTPSRFNNQQQQQQPTKKQKLSHGASTPSRHSHNNHLNHVLLSPRTPRNSSTTFMTPTRKLSFQAHNPIASTTNTNHTTTTNHNHGNNNNNNTTTTATATAATTNGNNQLTLLMKRTSLLQHHHHLTTPATIQNVKCIQSMLLQITYLNAMVHSHMKREEESSMTQLYHSHVLLFQMTQQYMDHWLKHMNKQHEITVYDLIQQLYLNMKQFMDQFHSFYQLYQQYTQLLEYSKHVIVSTTTTTNSTTAHNNNNNNASSSSTSNSSSTNNSILSLVHTSEHMIQCMIQQLTQYEQYMNHISSHMQHLNQMISECNQLIVDKQLPLVQHVIHDLTSEETSLSIHLKQQQQQQQQPQQSITQRATDTVAATVESNTINHELPLLFSALFQ